MQKKTNIQISVYDDFYATNPVTYLNCVCGPVKLTSLNLVAASLRETLVHHGIQVLIYGHARSPPSMVPTDHMDGAAARATNPPTLAQHITTLQQL